MNIQERILKAKATRQTTTIIGTYQDRPVLDRTIYGGEIIIADGDKDGATIRIYGLRSSVAISADPEDLRTIAAHCLAAAEEVEAAMAVTPYTAAR